jgi:hypothetical protein
VITARAVGRLAMLAELASPLLRPGGALVAWQGLIRFGRTEPDLVCRSMREIRPPAHAEALSGHRRRLTAV